MIALPRLVVASAGASLLALCISALIVRAPLAGLAAARIDHARHAELVARPPTPSPRPLPLGAMIGARTASAASDTLTRLLQQRALAAGLLVEALDPQPGAALAEAGVTLSGPEGALLRFVAETEADRPLIRFRTWRFTATPSAKVVRLDAIAVALWSDEA